VTTLPLTLLLGLLLGMVLSRLSPRLPGLDVDIRDPLSGRPMDLAAVAAVAAVEFVPAGPVGLRFYARLRAALLPVLTFSIGLWLPASLCVYREAPDWTLMYLLDSAQATPAALAGLFTLVTVSVPIGLSLGLIVDLQLGRRLSPVRARVVAWLLTALLFVGLLLLFRACAERVLWVGTHADFHDGRWLLLPLGRATPRLLTVLILVNAVIVAGSAAGGSGALAPDDATAP
jgi:hypothetical protein